MILVSLTANVTGFSKYLSYCLSPTHETHEGDRGPKDDATMLVTITNSVVQLKTQKERWQHHIRLVPCGVFGSQVFSNTRKCAVDQIASMTITVTVRRVAILRKRVARNLANFANLFVGWRFDSTPQLSLCEIFLAFLT